MAEPVRGAAREFHTAEERPGCKHRAAAAAAHPAGGERRCYCRSGHRVTGNEGVFVCTLVKPTETVQPRHEKQRSQDRRLCVCMRARVCVCVSVYCCVTFCVNVIVFLFNCFSISMCVCAFFPSECMFVSVCDVFVHVHL